jgi:CMP-N-acetylneuraminic acid synthetase
VNPLPKPVCIIPARGGSKRLPRKNIYPFFGHPLIAYTIAAAQNSALFSRIVVSTDDNEVGEIAAYYGAEYLPRPPALATDSAGLIDVCLHFLEFVRSTGTSAESFCQLMPNCPLKRADDIRNHYQAFVDDRREFQISVMPYVSSYPQWAMARDEKGVGSRFFGDGFIKSSQQLPEVFCPTGAVWWTRSEPFAHQRSHYGVGFHLEVISALHGVDIDTREDLEWAEIVVWGRRGRDGACPLEPVHTTPHPQGLSSRR